MPSSLFAPEQAPGRAQLLGWRDHVAHLWEVAAASDDGDLFSARSRSDHLGSAVLGRVQVGAIRINRSNALIARMGVDHFVLQHRYSGEIHGDADGTPVHVRPGDVCLFDQSRPLAADFSAYTAMTLLLPRSLLAAFVPDLDALHGAILRPETGLGALARDHVRSLAHNASRFGPADGRAAVHATAALMALCLAPSRPRDETSEAAKPAMLAAICRFIDERLQDPALDPDMVASRFNMSRSALYRAFEPVGGVAAQIRRRRLRAAHRELSRPQLGALRFEELAARFQLGSAANFSRAFTREFGCTPGEVRAGSAMLMQREALPGQAEQSALYHWTLTLSV